MRKHILFLIITLIVAIALSACGLQLETGEVIEKRYIPQMRTVQMMLVGRVAVPRPVVFPERYELRVQGINSDGETVTEWWSVDAASYSRAQIGMEVCR